MGGGEENNRFILNVTRAEGARAAKSLTPGFSSLSPPSVRPAADDFIQILMTAADCSWTTSFHDDDDGPKPLECDALRPPPRPFFY